jgi:amino acid transporter
MSKILVVAATAAVALGSVVATSDANARHLRAHGYYGYAPGYYGYAAPRGFRESPTYAPDAPATRSYNNPGVPDVQNGSRG